MWLHSKCCLKSRGHICEIAHVATRWEFETHHGDNKFEIGREKTMTLWLRLHSVEKQRIYLHQHSRKSISPNHNYLVTALVKGSSAFTKFLSKSVRVNFRHFHTVWLLQTWISTTCSHVGGNRSQMPIF